MISNREIGSWLARARKFLRIRQETAAQYLGVKRQTLGAIEKGKRPIRATELAVLCNLYRLLPGGQEILSDDKMEGQAAPLAEAPPPKR